jgi:hypothetical protein
VNTKAVAGKSSDRGRLVRAGIEGPVDHAMKNRKGQFVAGLILLVFPFSLPLILTISGVLQAREQVVLYIMWFVATGLPILWLAIFNLLGGLDIDAIFEDGVTNERSTVLDRILGKSYVRFEDVEIIAYGKEVEDDDEISFVALMSTEKRLLIKPFADVRYEDDFFDFLIGTLRTKCESADWMEVRWKDLRLV